MMKYFRWSEDYIMNSSWQKILLYSATIPDYSIKKDEDDGLCGAEKIAKQLEDSTPKLTPMARILGFKN